MISFGFVVCSRSVSAACAGWPSPSVASRLRPTACLCGPRGPQAFAVVATAGGNSASLESPAAVTSVSACGREWPVPPLAASLLASCGRRSLSFRVACASLGSFPVGIVWPAFPVVSGSLCLPWQLSCRHRVAGVPAVSGSLCLPWQLPVGVVWPAFLPFRVACASLGSSPSASCGRRSLSFRVACAFLGSSPSASCGRRSLFMPTKLLIKSETDKDFKFFE